jgi:PTS system nitrogen regulatory IIA component
MQIKDFLTSSNVVIDVPASSKAALLGDLARRAAAELKLDADAVANAVGKRDELGSTGIGSGVAIPHARLREIKKPFGLLARLKNPIDFAAIDGGPVDIVFLMLLPAASQLDQLNTLAAAARKLRDGGLLSKLRKATTAAELYRTIAD